MNPCRECGGPIIKTGRRGPPPVYCTMKCRVRYENRRYRARVTPVYGRSNICGVLKHPGRKCVRAHGPKCIRTPGHEGNHEYPREE